VGLFLGIHQQEQWVRCILCFTLLVVCVNKATMDKPKPYVIKKVGGSWCITIPPDFIHANDLDFGDYLVVDWSWFKILKAEDFALVGREPVLEPAE
jgi:hypothetical protein